jgi:hypothetical protein
VDQSHATLFDGLLASGEREVGSVEMKRYEERTVSPGPDNDAIAAVILVVWTATLISVSMLKLIGRRMGRLDTAHMPFMVCSVRFQVCDTSGSYWTQKMSTMASSTVGSRLSELRDG